MSEYCSIITIMSLDSDLILLYIHHKQTHPQALPRPVFFAQNERTAVPEETAVLSSI